MIKSAFNITIIFLICSLHSRSQNNLVVNGDFEEYSSCPQSESYPLQNPKEIEKCIGWRTPTFGTSDYFNVCASNPVISIPNNALGSQIPYNGDGYAGALLTSYTGGAGYDGYSGIMWWEYIQGTLSSSLEEGKIYKFSMEVSLSDGSDLMISELGAYFSNNQIGSPNTASLTVVPQCKFYNPDYFRDTLNWIHLESYFIASGGEKYITIGNFKNNVDTDTLRRYDLSPNGLNPFLTYFYIDHVVVNDFSSELPIANVVTPNGDGINDYWTFPIAAQAGKMKISIMNRWGNLIIDGDLSEFIWDGTDMSGSKCTEGTYYYKVNGTNIAGFIELIR